MGGAGRVGSSSIPTLSESGTLTRFLFCLERMSLLSPLSLCDRTCGEETAVDGRRRGVLCPRRPPGRAVLSLLPAAGDAVLKPRCLTKASFPASPSLRCSALQAPTPSWDRRLAACPRALHARPLASPKPGLRPGLFLQTHPTLWSLSLSAVSGEGESLR